MCKVAAMKSTGKNIMVRGYSLMNFTGLAAREKALVLKWRNDARIRKWMYSGRTITAAEHAKFVRGLAKDAKNYYWLVTSRRDGHIGVIYLNKADLQNKNAYLGLYANPDSEVKGRGAILMKCVLAAAFGLLRLHTVKLEVLEHNTRALEFYKKSGFNEEGRLKEFVLKNGRRYDVVVMGLPAGSRGRKR